MLKYYGYPKCSTCVKAKKYLSGKKIALKEFDITEEPPAKSVLKKALSSGGYALKDLFNKSGVLYRELNMKDKLPGMSEAEALSLLADNGKLIKRPIVTDGKTVTVGFKEEVFKKVWN